MTRGEIYRTAERAPERGDKPGFYVVVSHSGVTLGPLWGHVAAGELLGRTPDPRLAPYRPARFA